MRYTFRSLLVLILVLSASLTVLAGVPAPQEPAPLLGMNSTDRIEGRYIVVFKGDTSEKAVESAMETSVQASGGTVLRRYTAALNGFAAELSDEAVQTLRENPDVAYVEADQIWHVTGDQSPVTWGIDRIDQHDLPLNDHYRWDSSGSGVHAYIIDTGIRITHDEFGGRASYGYNALGSEDPTDDNGHGTHVAGTVGGSTYGVAKNVSLYAVKVCSDTCSASAIIDGVDWVTDNHNSPAVANMSLGRRGSLAVDDAVSASVSAGVFYAVAGGNTNTNACGYSPGRLAEVVTVGATNASDERAQYPDDGWISGTGSNHGDCLDLFAPGTSITSASHASDSATATMSGTSMASPHVTGVAALILEDLPKARPGRIFNILTYNATEGQLSDIGSGSPNRLVYSAEDAKFVTQDVPLEMVAGTSARVSITMKNSGVTEWRRDQGYKLGSQPAGDMTWGVRRVRLSESESIAPRKLKTFTFNITAPTEPGPYDFEWRMVHENVCWFGEQSPTVTISVRAPINGAEFVDQWVPNSMEVNETQTVWIKMKNTGETTWTRDSDYKLGSRNSTWGLSWVWLSEGDEVEPGETYTFTFDITAPPNPGDYGFQWQMMQESVGWFGDLTPNVNIQVNEPLPCPGTDHKWQSDYYGQPPHESPDQPDPPVCLNTDRCLYSTGSSDSHGTISGDWICSWDNVDGRSQGVWYLCESTRANANKIIEGYECEQIGGGYEWVVPTPTPTPTPTNTPTPTPTPTATPTPTPTPCPGTEHKWQSDYYGETPHESPDQPDPPVCLSDDRCLYSTGSAVAHGTLASPTWICSWDNIDSRPQGVWYLCESTRANANKVIEGYLCQQVSGGYEWLPEGP